MNPDHDCMLDCIVVCDFLSLFLMDAEDPKRLRRQQQAASAKRYRDKKKLGQPIQHHRTPQEQLVLLQQPYSELSEKDKHLFVLIVNKRANRHIELPHLFHPFLQ